LATPTAKTSSRRKIILWFFFVLFSLLATAEIALSAIGEARIRALEDQQVEGGSAGRILCAGDSFTYGVGDETDGSWPQYLREWLGPGFAVVNVGWPGANSSLVAANLPRWIEKHRPDLVLVMIGMNNRHNSMGVNRALLREDEGTDLLTGENIWGAVDSILWRFALYRLWRWSSVADDFKALMREYDPGPPAAYEYFRRLPATVQEMRDGPATDEPTRQSRERLWAAMKQGDADAAVAELILLFSQVKSRDDFSEEKINWLRWLKENGRPEQLEKVKAVLRANLSPEDYQICAEDPFLLQRSEAAAARVLWFDLEQIRKICEARGVRLAILTYPYPIFETTYYSFANVYRLPLIDNISDAYLSEDLRRHMHLNARGYRRLAENLYREGRKFGLWPSGDAATTPSAKEEP